MPRAPHFMPLLLLLLLLSLPHTQAAFPQDPLPLLTSDLQGECPGPTPLCEKASCSAEGRGQVASWHSGQSLITAGPSFFPLRQRC